MRGRKFFEKKKGPIKVQPMKQGNEAPYMWQYENKKEIERTLDDEGYFDEPEDRKRSQQIFVSLYYKARFANAVAVNFIV